MAQPALFARTRRRIIAAIMAVLAALFAATLAAIYAFSYAEVHERSMRELEDYARTYQVDRMPPGLRDPNPADAPPPALDEPEPVPRRAPFYAVLFDASGAVLSVENPTDDGYGDDELVALAEKALAGGEREGSQGALLFAVNRAPGYELVALMDNTLMAESMGTLFRYTLIVGIAACAALFFAARWLAGRIVAPMEEAYEAQRRFIADAGHELKTPVAVVEANAELLQREAGPSQWLQNIRYENGRMGALVEQLLELARADQGTPPRETVDLSRTVQREALSFESVAFEKGMPFSWEVAEGIEVEGDGSELAKLTANLLGNAFEHGVPESPVSLRLARQGREARLEVANGIEPGQAERLEGAALFDRFARADEARTGSDGDGAPGHYGLGLAIARAIAESHGGTLAVSIDAETSTIAFIASFPLKKR